MRRLIVLSLIILCCMGCKRENNLDTGTLPSPVELERHNSTPAPYASDNTNPFKKDWEKLCKGYPYKANQEMTQELYDTLRKLNLIYEGNYSPSADYINTYCRSYLDNKNNVKGRLR